MSENYKTIHKNCSEEIIEKKSRFIATIAPVETLEQAEAFICDCKKKYYDARHNCYAVVLAKDQLVKCSDDGEPSGTAGKPILEVLVGAEIKNVVAVVTRYFGGTLLGTGGLVRAYQKATKEAIGAATIIERKCGYLFQVEMDYNEVGKIQYYLSQEGICINNSIYETSVILELLVEIERKEKICKDLTELTAGKIGIKEGEEVTYSIINKEIEMLRH